MAGVGELLQGGSDRKARTGLLWFGALAGPAAWAVQLASLYSLEEFISCTPGSRTPGAILGLGVRPLALAITAVTAAVTAAAGAVSVMALRRLGRQPQSDAVAARAKWMAAAGIMSSVLFFIIIIVKIAPPLLLDVCRQAL